MAHRRGSFRRSGISDAQRRKKLWSPFTSPYSDGVTQGTAASNTLHFELASGSGLPAAQEQSQSLGISYAAQGGLDQIPPESTIIRIRGSLLMQKNTAAATQLITFGFGLGVMETGAALLGAFPNPATPDGSEWDGWMFYRSINVSTLDSQGTIVDIKAMRKVQSGQSLVIVAGVHDVAVNSAVDITTVSAISADFTARALLLLP